jgi:hypothetical protein
LACIWGTSEQILLAQAAIFVHNEPSTENKIQTQIGGSKKYNKFFPKKKKSYFVSYLEAPFHLWNLYSV